MTRKSKGKRRSNPTQPVRLSLRDECYRLARKHKSLPYMPYRQFLRTKYWQNVRQLKLNNSSGRCEYCGSCKDIHVHHETYIHRGCEYDYLDDLTIVCRNCHDGIHGIVCGVD